MEKKTIYDIRQIEYMMREILGKNNELLIDYTKKKANYTMSDILSTIGIITEINDLEEEEINQYIYSVNIVSSFNKGSEINRFNTILGITRLFYYYPEIVKNWGFEKIFIMSLFYDHTANDRMHLSEQLIIDNDCYDKFKDDNFDAMYANIKYEKHRLELENYTNQKKYS